MSADAEAPVLSVLCITFNHAAYIAQALDSFLEQRTSFAVEIVVSDDASTDATLAILHAYRDRHPKEIRVLDSVVNQGVTRNFRRALSACRGKYIAICEGDDFWRGQTKLQRQVDFLEAHPEYVIAFHDATVIQGLTEGREPQLPPRFRSDASSRSLIMCRPVSTLTVCFRNVLTELPKELDYAPILDLCLWSLLGHHGMGKYLQDIEPAAYRVHAGGVHSMQTFRNRQLMSAQSLLCLARVYSRCGMTKLSDDLVLKANVIGYMQLDLLHGCKLIAGALARLIIRYPHALWTRAVSKMS